MPAAPAAATTRIIAMSIAGLKPLSTAACGTASSSIVSSASSAVVVSSTTSSAVSSISSSSSESASTVSSDSETFSSFVDSDLTATDFVFFGVAAAVFVGCEATVISGAAVGV